MAAGQSQVNDRNNDYADISKKMAFPMGRVLQSHDYVFWCGDFNYRIDLPNEEVKELVKNENWSALQAMDQLNVQRREEKTFQGFSEGCTDFAPTYKYDLFCDDYDTSDKSRTPAWTDRVLWRHNPFLKYQASETDQVEDWPTLLLYTRSELKTSDHRPVMGLFDMQCLKVREADRDRVYEEVMYSQGPQDATIIVSTQDAEFDDELVDEIVGTFSEAGEIILVRFVDEEMWLIYKAGHMTLEAVKYDNTEIGGKQISVRLKTGNWRDLIGLEMKLSCLQAEPLFNTITNSLLGEDFDSPTMDNYDSEGEDDEEGQDNLKTPQQPARSVSPHSGSSSPADGMFSEPSSGPPPLRPQPVSRARPPPPTARPREATPPEPGRTTPVGTTDQGKTTVDEVKRAADTVIVPEHAPRIRGNPPTEAPTSKPAPPQRPGPPVKPPPPQRPAGGPPRPSAPATVSKPTGSPQRMRKPLGPNIKQPLGPQDISKIKSKQQHKITNIGLPTNVTHMGHAKSPEEAAQLIEKLLQSGGADMKGTLPAPLKPGGMKANVPRSKTSNDIPKAEGSGLAPPTLAARTHSVENLSTNPSAQPQKPVPTRRGDSIDEKDPASKPKPAPRRNVQSCFIDPYQSSAPPPPTAPRPVSMINRGELPPLPKNKPETSQNYYACVVDQHQMDHQKASVLLNDLDTKKSETDVVESSEARSDNHGIEYETIWGQAPVVPKRRDIAEDNTTSLLDKPLSPQACKTVRDPFDTSEITQMLPKSVPLIPTSTGAVENGVSSTINMPMVPPRPKAEANPVSNDFGAEFDSFRDLGSGNNQAPPLTPPPSPPTFACPGLPPPPPPRQESSLCNNELMDSNSINSDSQPDFSTPTIGLKQTAGAGPGFALPPVPARPMSHDSDSANQEPVLMEMPPIPARPAPPPPIPKRPT